MTIKICQSCILIVYAVRIYIADACIFGNIKGRQSCIEEPNFEFQICCIINSENRYPSSFSY